MKVFRFAVAVTAVWIALPQTQTGQAQPLPEGAGKDATERACTTCHELSVVTAERHTEKQWKDLVDDMVRRGAEASDSEKKLILAYLIKNFGK